MRANLTQLNGREFDVLVVGAGINGASAAQHLAAEGYSVLLVDKGDFGSGATSRSSRLLHCGIRYFVPGSSLWEFVRHPDRAINALKMARMAMAMRAQMKRTTPQRLRSLKWCYPMYRDGQYKPWQFDAAFRLLDALGPADVPLGYHKLSGDEARTTPLLKWQRRPEAMLGAAVVEEFQYHWPERIAVDAALDAERLGATILNHTPVVALAQSADGKWTATLADRFAHGAQACVTAKAVVNTAGVWIDKVDALASAGASRKVHGTKGVHIAFKLQAECGNYAVVNFSRDNQPLFCAPFGDLHYIGPSEVNYSGDPDDVAPTNGDIELMVEEANLVLPGLGLERSDVRFAWAGVRPLTYGGAAYPKGNRLRVLHDLDSDGMSNALALTAGPIMTHRSAASEIVMAIRRKLAPSLEPQSLSYAARAVPDNHASPPLLAQQPAVRHSDLRHAALHEHPQTLVDLLFRRVPVGWSDGMGYDACRAAALVVADLMAWDNARIEHEVEQYQAHVRHFYQLQKAPVPEFA